MSDAAKIDRAAIKAQADADKKARLEALKEAFVADYIITGPRILVEVDPPKSESESIIQLLDNEKNADRHAMTRGRVRAMGNTCYNLESHRNPDTEEKEKWCAVGDVVWFGQYAGSRILEEGCELLYVLNDEDIQGRKRAKP